MAFEDIKVRMGLDSTKFEKRLEKSRLSVRSFASDAAKSFGAIGAGVALAQSLKGFVTFEKRAAEVFSLLPNMSKESFDKMNKDVLEFSSRMGVDAVQATEALYQAISAGVPTENAITFLETATRASIGGVTDLTTAVDGITSAVNAYGAGNLSAKEASDLLFTAVRLGKTNFSELSQFISGITPFASALGVGFDQVTAALAAITAQGTPTGVAVTQLRSLLKELNDQGTDVAKTFTKASGKTFKDFIASGGKLDQALSMINDQVKSGGTQFDQLFSSVEASVGALQLLDNPSFAKALNDVADSAGATDAAFKKLEETTGRRIERALSTVKSWSLSVVDSFLSASEAAGRYAGQLVYGTDAAVGDFVETQKEASFAVKQTTKDVDAMTDSIKKQTEATEAQIKSAETWANLDQSTAALEQAGESDEQTILRLKKEILAIDKAGMQDEEAFVKNQIKRQSLLIKLDESQQKYAERIAELKERQAELTIQSQTEDQRLLSIESEREEIQKKLSELVVDSADKLDEKITLEEKVRDLNLEQFSILGAMRQKAQDLLDIKGELSKPTGIFGEIESVQTPRKQREADRAKREEESRQRRLRTLAIRGEELDGRTGIEARSRAAGIRADLAGLETKDQQKAREAADKDMKMKEAQLKSIKNIDERLASLEEGLR